MKKATKAPRITPADQNAANGIIAAQAIEDQATREAREAAARWWATVAAVMNQLWSDVQALRAELRRPGSPLTGFIHPDGLWTLLKAIEAADSAASSALPCLLDIPRPVV